ncbi:MAG: 30S ribosomal protein S13 [Thermoprotei archaeon]
MSTTTYRAIVRLMGVDLPGNVKVGYALPRIRGVGVSFANAALHVLGIDPNLPVGVLTDKHVSDLENLLRNPLQYGIPSWLFNRQRDPITGGNQHVIGPDLLMALRRDVETMIKTKSWKGIRHSLGLKVRGQKTKTTGRLGQTVGVKRKKELAHVQQQKTEANK